MINTYCALLHFLLLRGKSHHQYVLPACRLLLLLLQLLLRLLQSRHIIGWKGGGKHLESASEAIQNYLNVQYASNVPAWLQKTMCFHCIRLHLCSTYNIGLCIWPPRPARMSHTVSTWRSTTHVYISMRYIKKALLISSVALIFTVCTTPLWSRSLSPIH